ncbi:MAG: hypothetical protein E7348_01745 [Clostridiales bacterium]|nr:hypothetical protein [Clostridiales bacterium]
MKKKIVYPLVILLVAIFALGIAFIINNHKKQTISIVFEGTITAENTKRNENFLVLYSQDVERNEYGYELLVEKDTGFIIDADIIVEMIDDTFVLSAHGTNADLLRTAKVGDIVRIEKDTLTVERNMMTSNLKQFEIKNKKLDEIVQNRKTSLYDVDFNAIKEIDDKINQATKAFKRCFYTLNIDEIKVKNSLTQLDEFLDEKYYLTFESYAVDGRGIWHRPNDSAIDERTLDGVKNFVSTLNKLGINNLYVETYWQGLTTHYSDYLGSQHPKMANNDYGEYGNDYLLALISECHKVGIEVHAWFEVLNAGITGLTAPSHIKDEWLSANLLGDTSDLCLDPSNPEVVEYVCSLLSEMLEKYDFDGISYDYIRYAETGTYNGYTDCGFTKYSIDRFSKEYNYTGNDLISDLHTNENLRKSWHEFKKNAVTALVQKMSALIRQQKPETIISASPYGYISDAKEIYMQDTLTWIEYGCLDVVLPMIYTENEELLVQTASSYVDYSDKVLQYTGMSPLYNGATLRKNQELTFAVKSLGISGFSYFATKNYIPRNKHYSEKILLVLSNSTHKNRAISPTDHESIVFSAWKNQLLDRYERIYSDYLTESDKNRVERFDLDTKNNLDGANDISQVLATLSDFKRDINNFSNYNVRDRITEQIDYIYKILSATLTRYSYR